MLVRTRSRYLRFTCLYTKVITDENYVKKLMKDEDIEKRKLLFIIHENKLDEIIENTSIQDVIDILWNGDIGSQNSIFDLFSLS
jgi:hypothetical protein